MFYEFEFFMPRDFLELSKQLFCKLDDFDLLISALKRTIYSRTYYSVFLHVREWLVVNSKYVSTVDDHSNIPEFIRFNGPFTPDANIEIASNLEILKKLRLQADYYVGKGDAIRYNHIWVDKSI